MREIESKASLRKYEWDETSKLYSNGREYFSSLKVTAKYSGISQTIVVSTGSHVMIGNEGLDGNFQY